MPGTTAGVDDSSTAPDSADTADCTDGGFQWAFEDDAFEQRIEGTVDIFSQEFRAEQRARTRGQICSGVVEVRCRRLSVQLFVFVGIYILRPLTHVASAARCTLLLLLLLAARKLLMDMKPAVTEWICQYDCKKYLARDILCGIIISVILLPQVSARACACACVRPSLACTHPRT